MSLLLHTGRQLTASFHAELYHLVPEDHLLRRIHRIVDFSFIHELVENSYCKYYGRPANEPELLFRLLFLQILYNLSDERIVQEAQVNLAYKWFIGVNPEDPLPDGSQLSRFRNHRLGASQVEDVLKQVVSQCVEKGLIKSKTIILDATHTQAGSQKQRPLDVLRDAAKRLLRTVVKRHPKLENPIVHHGGERQEGFEYNKDADFVICPAGQHNTRKAMQGSKQSGNSRSLVFYYDVEKCKTCPLSEGCYKPGSKSKTYSIRIIAERFEEQIEFELSDTFKERIVNGHIPTS
jgi:transposase